MEVDSSPSESAVICSKLVDTVFVELQELLHFLDELVRFHSVVWVKYVDRTVELVFHNIRHAGTQPDGRLLSFHLDTDISVDILVIVGNAEVSDVVAVHERNNLVVRLLTQFQWRGITILAIHYRSKADFGHL